MIKPKFQIGDWVRVKDCTETRFLGTAGQEGQITGYPGGRLYKLVEDGGNPIGGFYYARELELVSKKPTL